MRYVVFSIAGLLILVLAVAGVIALGNAADNSPQGDVLTGSDLGFRVVGMSGDRVVGILIVKVNGEWLETEQPPLPPVIPAR